MNSQVFDSFILEALITLIHSPVIVSCIDEIFW